MNTYFSPYVVESHPQLRGQLNEILRVAQALDSDIASNDLFVHITSAPILGPEFGGTAWPCVVSKIWKGRYAIHKDGKITMYLGPTVGKFEIACLFGHELRHCGQFHRSRLRLGHLALATDMTKKQAEDDCFQFEEQIVDRLGIKGMDAQ